MNLPKLSMGELISYKEAIDPELQYLVIEVDPETWGEDTPSPFIYTGTEVIEEYFSGQSHMSEEGRAWIYEILIES